MGQGFLHMLKPFSPTIVIMLAWVFQPFGIIGSLVFFIVALGTLVAGVATIHRKKTEQTLISEAERIKRMFSHQRHDWMNHVQVMMGYLSLQKPERIHPYLQKLIQEAAQERAISEIKYAPLAVALLTLSHQYPEWDVQVQVESKFELPELEDEKKMFQIVETVFPWLKKQVQDQSDWNQLEVSVEQREFKAFLSIQMFQADGSLAHFDFPSHEWEQLRHSIKKWDAEVEVDHNEGLQIMLQL